MVEYNPRGAMVKHHILSVFGQSNFIQTLKPTLNYAFWVTMGQKGQDKLHWIHLITTALLPTNINTFEGRRYNYLHFICIPFALDCPANAN